VGESVEDVGGRHDAPGERYLLALEADRVARAVPPLVVRERDLLARGEWLRPRINRDEGHDDLRVELATAQPVDFGERLRSTVSGMPPLG
jgi:hypothetical protein